MSVCATFILCCQLAELNGITSIRELPGCWEHQVDDDWRLSFNGHDHHVIDSAGEPVPPFTVLTKHTRAIALGFITPVGGMVAGCAESDLMGALESAIRELGGVPATEEPDEQEQQP